MDESMTNSSSQQNNSSADRRYLPRWEVNNRVLYRTEDAAYPHECTSRDIHYGGMCIKSKESIVPGQELMLTIQLSPKADPIEASGRSVWSRADADETVAGIRFERLTSEAHEMIYNYAFEFQRGEMTKNWFKGW